MNTYKRNAIFKDIRFWIILFFVIRLIGITNAPLETGHNWRQSLTNMVARNFLESGVDIMHPKIDMAGEKTGIIGSEFPFFNYLIYLFNYFFGAAHWYGRLINLFISSIGLFYFYKLIKGLFNRDLAFNATIILASSVWFAFSRKIMPDTLSVSLMIIGLYNGYIYLKDEKKLGLLGFFFFTALGMLVKIPTLALFSAVFVAFFIKSIPLNRRIKFAIAAAGSFIVMVSWYFLWVPHLLKTYQYELYSPKGLRQGILEIIPHFSDLLEKFYFSAFHSFVAFACFAIGLALFLKQKNKTLILGFVLISAFFVVFIVKTGVIFPTHNYYIIPYVPVMAIFAGLFLSKIPHKMQATVLVIIASEAIANQQHDFFIPKSQLYKLDLEEHCAAMIPKNELIVINGGQSPQDMYFAHCKGWTVSNEDAMNSRYLDSLSTLGASYLVIDKNRLETVLPTDNEMYSDDDYSIYTLKKND